MANPPRYDVTIPRAYKDSNGTERTHFWLVGSAFPLREHEGLSVKLYSRMLLSDQFVIFRRDEDESEKPPAPKDDLPF
jgi:hypothetical protein